MFALGVSPNFDFLLDIEHGKVKNEINSTYVSSPIDI